MKEVLMWLILSGGEIPIEDFPEPTLEVLDGLAEICVKEGILDNKDQMPFLVWHATHKNLFEENWEEVINGKATLDKEDLSKITNAIKGLSEQNCEIVPKEYIHRIPTEEEMKNLLEMNQKCDVFLNSLFDSPNLKFEKRKVIEKLIQKNTMYGQLIGKVKFIHSIPLTFGQRQLLQQLIDQHGENAILNEPYKVIPEELFYEGRRLDYQDFWLNPTQVIDANRNRN